MNVQRLLLWPIYGEVFGHSLDRVDGRDLQIWDDNKVAEMYAPYYEYLLNNKESFPHKLYNKYIW